MIRNTLRKLIYRTYKSGLSNDARVVQERTDVKPESTHLAGNYDNVGARWVNTTGSALEHSVGVHKSTDWMPF